MRDSPVVVRVFGVPIADACGARDGWRAATDWVERSLAGYFGDQVRVEYIDLFSDHAVQYPAAMELVASGKATPPLVFVGDDLLTSGGKISGPAIRRQLEAIGLTKQNFQQVEQVPSAAASSDPEPAKQAPNEAIP